MNKYLIAVVITGLLLGGCSLFPPKNDQNINLPSTISMISSTPPATSSSISPSTSVSSDPIVSLKTKNGEILIRLYRNLAPNTVTTFISKADSGFYNNLTFHRVIADFMAQGGDPTGTGTGGNRQISEINTVPFKRGSLGLARTPDTKEFSNDSQFFICFSTSGCQHLTGDYVNFGEVVSGLEVLDLIQQGDKIISLSSQTK